VKSHLFRFLKEKFPNQAQWYWTQNIIILHLGWYWDCGRDERFVPNICQHFNCWMTCSASLKWKSCVNTKHSVDSGLTYYQTLLTQLINNYCLGICYCKVNFDCNLCGSVGTFQDLLLRRYHVSVKCRNSSKLVFHNAFPIPRSMLEQQTFSVFYTMHFQY